MADGAGEALPVVEEVVDGGPLPEIIVAPMAPSAQAPVFRELHVSQPEGLAVGIAELVYDRRRAPVVSKVECVSSRGFEQKEHRKLSSLSIGSAHAF